MASTTLKPLSMVQANQNVLLREEDLDRCVICCDEENNEPLIPLHLAPKATGVGGVPHAFHLECIMRGVKFEEDRVVCPLCRARIPIAETRVELKSRLYLRQFQVELQENMQFIQQIEFIQLQQEIQRQESRNRIDLGFLGEAEINQPLTRKEIKFLAYNALALVLQAGMLVSWIKNPKMTGEGVFINFITQNILWRAVNYAVINFPCNSIFERIQNVMRGIFNLGFFPAFGSNVGSSIGGWIGFPFIGRVIGWGVGFLMSKHREDGREHQNVGEVGFKIINHAGKRIARVFADVFRR